MSGGEEAPKVEVMFGGREVSPKGDHESGEGCGVELAGKGVVDAWEAAYAGTGRVGEDHSGLSVVRKELASNTTIHGIASIQTIPWTRI